MGRGERTRVRTRGRKFLPLIGTILVLIYPVMASAAFLIQLKNGGELRTNEYWEDANRIMFYAHGGVVGIQKNLVKGIKELDVPDEDKASEQNEVSEKSMATGKTQDDKATEVSPEVTEPPPKESTQTSNTENINRDYYRDKKRELQDKIDQASLKYREATANEDFEAKEKARLDILEFTRQMYALADALKQENGGVLPGWWEQL